MVIILLTTDAKNEVVAVAYGFQTWAPDFRTRSSRIIIRGGFVKRTVTEVGSQLRRIMKRAQTREQIARIIRRLLKNF